MQIGLMVRYGCGSCQNGRKTADEHLIRPMSRRLSAGLVAASDAPAVPTAALKVWLTERGFARVEWGVTFHRGRVGSIFGPEKEIEASVGEEAWEITDLYVRFTLTRRSPPPLPEWAGFAAELCRRFHFRLGAEGVAPCGAAEFLAAVRGHRSYREFAASFGWEAG